jgi:hypothetical protein
MKKLILSIIFLIPFGLLSLNAEGLSPDKTNVESAGTLKMLKMPFASTGKATMELVYKNGQYSLWRCEESAVDQYPGKGLTGKTYNYFVYKNEKYHLAVKENNKDDIFMYFSGTK